MSTPVGARTVAHDILLRVEASNAFADRLLTHRLAGESLPPREQALATQLVYGTLAWQGRLDHHLASLLHTPLTSLDAPVRAALRLGLYQLLFLDRVPPYAAVDASVRLARAAGRGAGAGLVNAVLRRAAAAGRAGLPLPARADRLGRLATEWSHPRWLVERWAAELGEDELAALLPANNVQARLAVRANRLRTTRESLVADLMAAGIDATPGDWARDAVVIERGGARLRGLTAYRSGHLAFQGEASQLVAELLDPPPGSCLIDACAAPGGKTAHLAALLGGTGLVVASDLRPGGMARVRRESTRLGATNVVVAVAADARRLPLGGRFDAVLVDAPCSGLGTLRRHPELRWRRQPDDIPRLAALQREIVLGVAPLVRPGGVLVYAVCTLAREENEEIVAALRTAHPRFGLESAADHVPATLVGADGFLRTLPHRHGLDGFFAARLRAAA